MNTTNINYHCTAGEGQLIQESLNAIPFACVLSPRCSQLIARLGFSLLPSSLPSNYTKVVLSPKEESVQYELVNLLNPRETPLIEVPHGVEMQSRDGILYLPGHTEVRLDRTKGLIPVLLLTEPLNIDKK